MTSKIKSIIIARSLVDSTKSSIVLNVVFYCTISSYLIMYIAMKNTMMGHSPTKHVVFFNRTRSLPILWIQWSKRAKHSLQLKLHAFDYKEK